METHSFQYGVKTNPSPEILFFVVNPTDKIGDRTLTHKHKKSPEIFSEGSIVESRTAIKGLCFFFEKAYFS